MQVGFLVAFPGGVCSAGGIHGGFPLLPVL